LKKGIEEKKDKLKVIIAENGEIIPDIYDKLPGNCIWIGYERQEIEKLIAKRSKSALDEEIIYKCKNLCSAIEKQLRKNIFLKLSLARKSGQAMSGFENVKMAIKSDSVGLLFHACDGSKKELGRITNSSLKLPVVDLFNSEELGKVFNKDTIVHSCVLKCSLANSLILDVKKLEGIQN